MGLGSLHAQHPSLLVLEMRLDRGDRPVLQIMVTGSLLLRSPRRTVDTRQQHRFTGQGSGAWVGLPPGEVARSVSLHAGNL